MWLDKHLNIHNEISKENNPALLGKQKAYFRKSIHGHLWRRKIERGTKYNRKDKLGLEKDNLLTNVGYYCNSQ